MTVAIPVPQGNYVPAKRVGGLLFTAGMTPRRNGRLIMTGPVRSTAPAENYRDAVVLACTNALAAARAQLDDGETLSAILNLSVFIAAETGFDAHTKLADFASDYLRAELGPEGISARTAVGVATLPGNAPVEIQITAVI